ncbi:hypothetical protein CHL76_05000 [Marinococcus halophilus]|uniref:Uncharacterized protein n=1 Tax=Marinococcus halophilus TaxID=1371 RepID=A0A510Y837_MARHA|nr:hypothetical protein [Marinococcus halophilus]OZT81128.1 hypothetical protein CHL76_05000 [Marinococcus halophilus]GEK58851.1 hypothetical protein MHA01_17560 [Marinococcus halophilus]
MFFIETFAEINWVEWLLLVSVLITTLWTVSQHLTSTNAYSLHHEEACVCYDDYSRVPEAAALRFVTVQKKIPDASDSRHDDEDSSYFSS